MQEVIKTKRLHLRFMEAGDEKYIFPAVNSDLTKYWIGWEPPRDLAEQRRRIKDFLDLSKKTINIYFLAFEKASGSFIGCCGVVPYLECKEFEVDLWVKQQEQGKGYAKEMLFSLISWSRENLKLLYITYSITEGNEASFAIVKKLNLSILRTFIAEKSGQKKLITDYKITLEK